MVAHAYKEVRMRAMRAMMRKTAAKATIGLFAVLLLCGTAMAGVVYQETFDGGGDAVVRGGVLLDTGSGKGWSSDIADDPMDRRSTVDFPALPLAEGTIEVEIYRKSVPAGARYQSGDGVVFALNAADGSLLLEFRSEWVRYRFPDDGAVINVWAERTGKVDSKGKLKHESYGAVLELGYDVPLGEKVHLVVSWKNQKTSVYADGILLGMIPVDMGGLLNMAATIRFGMETNTRRPVGGWMPMASGILDNVRVVDEALAPAALADLPPIVPSPEVASVAHDAAQVAGFSGKLVAGDVMTVTMEGTAGGEASFDVLPVSDIRGEIPVSWKGWGVYLEDITFFEEDQVNLRDVEEYRVYVSADPIGAITLETEPVETLEVEQQSYTVDSVSVPAEDGQSYNLELLEADTPYYVAVMALMDDDSLRPVIEPLQGVAMSEVEEAPGSYEGTYTVDYQDRYAEAVVVGRLGVGDAQAVMVSADPIEVDPALKIQVASSVGELKADEESTSQIKVTPASSAAGASPTRSAAP
jgi:hypothetical protein